MFDSTPQANKKGCREKGMDGDQDEVGERRRISRRKATAVTLEHSVQSKTGSLI